ncbi:MAG: rRNA ((966)-N(2))-methyltransferase RsmD [Bacteroidota bacterium]|jgi:16S rRNA (guanine(966)-N(2))-methyltransferase RsmD
MRIVSGKWRGKRITAPKKLPTRPTTDFAKEALFNLLNNRFYFEDIRVLDLFAGTGNISYEFASRGTEDITCVDANRDCVRFINATAEELGVHFNVQQADALLVVRRAATAYDVVFADPPYEYEHYEELAQAIMDKNILSPGGEAIIEHSAETDLSHIEGFLEHRKYGHVNFSFFSAAEEE